MGLSVLERAGLSIAADDPERQVQGCLLEIHDRRMFGRTRDVLAPAGGRAQVIETPHLPVRDSRIEADWTIQDEMWVKRADMAYLPFRDGAVTLR